MAITETELETFYAETEVKLYNFALRWLWNPGLAEEVVHDAFIRIWERRDQVDPSTLRGLVFKTIQNLALNEIRKNKLRSTVPILEWLFPAPSVDLESEFGRKQDLRLLRDRLEQLPVDVKETFLLCEFSGLSYAEIGKLQKIPEGTVASRKNRALHLLKEKFRE